MCLMMMCVTSIVQEILSKKLELSSNLKLDGISYSLNFLTTGYQCTFRRPSNSITRLKIAAAGFSNLLSLNRVRIQSDELVNLFN